MTSTSASESDSEPGFSSRIGLLAGKWLPHDQMRLPVDDLGFRQGVTVVDRLRTYQRRIFAIDAHLDRWHHSISELSIVGLPSRAEIVSLIEDLLNRNAALVDLQGDVGITIFATPGYLAGEAQNSVPTFGLHLNRLNHALRDQRRQQGQPLVVSGVHQPDPNCWPRSIKVRSRLHYFLADQQAKQQNPDAGAVLRDNDAGVTETSIANLAIVRDGQIISPPAGRVLGGITQSVIETLASQSSIPWSKGPISATELSQADEILLMGTDNGIWFASSVDGRPVGTGNPGDIYLALRQRFDHLVEASGN